MSKYNLIFHITTSCNFDCSYCDVIKDNQFLSEEARGDIVKFVANNFDSIESFKFFGGEPLLAFSDIKNILEQGDTDQKYNLVTNTSLLKDEHGKYFQNNFNTLFFSIDSENDFDFMRTKKFIAKYDLEKKVYFNLIISPGQEIDAYKNFMKLYESGLRGFNILPVYFTLSGSLVYLKSLSLVMKKICTTAFSDSSLRLYGFQENIGYETNLFNNVLFIDIDGKLYYSDIVSTFYGQEIKDKLYLGDIKTLSLKNLEKVDFSQKRMIIDEVEQKIYKQVAGQEELHKIMDYFSKYLNNGK